MRASTDPVYRLTLFDALKLISDEEFKELQVRAEFNRDIWLGKLLIRAKRFRNPLGMHVSRVMAQRVNKPVLVAS